MTKPRVLSGVQPTGNLHLGNYLGAIRNWVGLQESHECLFMLADLHAITVPQDPAALTRNTRETAAAYIACGIDPNKSAIFPQSNVSMHAELAWILNNHTPLGWLNRMTQFKEKTGQSRSGVEKLIDETKKLLKDLQKESEFIQKFDAEDRKHATDVRNQISHEQQSSAWSARSAHEQFQINYVKARREETALSIRDDFWKGNFTRIGVINELLDIAKRDLENTSNSKLGLYAYPVLMAADIIGYHATHVPVGADQKQHLELARDIAGAFNRAYGEEFFPIPEPLILGTATRVMSLTDGTKKMSKSDPSDYSRITLTDDADAIANKIKKAQTDSDPALTYDEKARPSVANLLTLYAALSDSTPQKVAEQFATLKTGQFKAQLAELAVEKLSPITARMRELMNDDVSLDAILKQGTEKARSIALPILAETKQRVGLLTV